MRTETMKALPLNWIGLGLAAATAGAYLLIAAHILGAGSLVVDQEGGVIVYVAAGAYLLGGLLILPRLRWLLALGLLVNALVVAFFFMMYQARPDVLLSPAGLISKTTQVLLEAALLALLIQPR